MVKNILVVECVTSYNWYKIFDGAKLTSGEEIRIEQGSWQEINMTGYHDSGLIVSLSKAKNPLPNTPQNTSRTIKPHFILMRSLSQFLNDSSKNKLYAIQFCNVPTLNTFRSIYGMLEKPVVYGELKKIQKQLKNEHDTDFPLIEPTFYPTHHSMIITPSFPLVVKIGHHHSGYGKIKCDKNARFDDVKSIVAIHNDYCTAEEFIDYDFEIRIQKIGPSVRCFKRRSMNWKGNVGNASVNEDVECTKEFKLWIDYASKIFGGLDICALDLVHCSQTDRYKILELNGTAIGLVRRHANEDMNMMRDMVVREMSKIYSNNEQKSDDNDNDIEEDEEEKAQVDGKDDDNDNVVHEEEDEALLQAIAKIRQLEKYNDELKGNQKTKDCLIM